MKKVKKYILYLLGILTVVLIALISSVFLFKDKIIQRFISEANKKLNTPVKIAKIEVSSLANFPNISIILKDVYIEDSHPGLYPLATSRQVSFTLNPLEMWRGNYTIKGMRVEGCEVNLKVNAAGVPNYIIMKETPPGEANIGFDLKNVKLKDVTFLYSNATANHKYVLSSSHLAASVNLVTDIYHIITKGEINSEEMIISGRKFLEKKNFDIDALIDYNDDAKKVSLAPSTLRLGKSIFEISGEYVFKQKDIVDLRAIGKETTIHTLLSLLPHELTESVKDYQSEGDVFFNLSVKGEISKSKSPFLSAAFGFNNATITHPETGMKVSKANLEGSFASPSIGDLSRAELFLKEISGELNEKSFSADLSIQNFKNPIVDFDFKGELDATSIGKFINTEEITNLTGRLTADVSLQGAVQLLKEKATAQQVKIRGSIDLNSLNFTYKKKEADFKNLNGTLQFNNNDLALSNVSGQLGKSDFLLNGFFKNIVTYLLFEDQPVGIETELKSNHIDLNELLETGFGDSESEKVRFYISPNVHLNFNCDIHTLTYKRLNAKNIKGDLLVKNQMAVSRQIMFDAMGGSLTLSGIADAKNPKATDVSAAFNLKGVHLDSIFFVFENFRQDFIQDKHLKGVASAEVSMDMTLNENLILFPESLVADVSAVVQKGELNNFEPLKALNKYLDDDGLSRLRFADLKNEIHIENKTIYIPQMDIKSNVTNIQLSGTHSFDQHIDYRVVAPLRNKKKIDPDEAFGAIEDDGRGQSKIFLKITGTTDKYDVSLDKQAVKKKIAADLKKEIQELKDAFKAKGKKKKKELELEKDDYFDWDHP